MSDVFVSYKAEDRRRVKPLVESLEADGYSVWWDAQIGGGAQWRHMIETELTAAKCVIVAWSKRSVGPEGTFVQDEATRAQERHVYIPVLFDKVHLPLGFGEMQALPLTGWKGDRSDPRYQAILAAVARFGGRSSNPSAPNAPGVPMVSRRAVVGGGAVAAVAIAGVGGWTLLKPTAASASRSIAVLPFANLSGDPRQAYFSDGIAEELRSALGRIGGLQVAGRTSSEVVRNDDAATAARKLGVANILSGSVRQSPSTIRVTAELIDGKTGMSRWSEDYDRAPGDAIKVQTDIAENVAQALSAALGGAARAAMAVGGTNNATAQKLLLQADEIARDLTKANAETAMELIDSAIALDPNYAEAYARKAGMLGRYANNFARGSDELVRYRAEALRSARTAVRLAPGLARAHIALASVYSNNLQLGPAFDEYKRALQAAPNDAVVLRTYGDFVSRLGITAGDELIARRIIATDPLNPGSYGYALAGLFYRRRYAEVVRYAAELQRKSPELVDDTSVIADSLLMLGKYREALGYYAAMPADKWQRLNGETLIFVRTGDRANANRMLARFNQVYGDAASYQFAEIYAQMGDRDRAFAALEHAFDIRDAGIQNIKIDPLLDPIRDDPRFAAIVAKMNFPT